MAQPPGTVPSNCRFHTERWLKSKHPCNPMHICPSLQCRNPLANHLCRACRNTHSFPFPFLLSLLPSLSLPLSPFPLCFPFPLSLSPFPIPFLIPFPLFLSPFPFPVFFSFFPPPFPFPLQMERSGNLYIYICNYICRYMYIYNIYKNTYYYIHIKMHFLAHAIHVFSPNATQPPALLSRSKSSTGGCLVCWSTSSWRDQPPLRPHTPCRSMPKSWDLDAMRNDFWMINLDGEWWLMMVDDDDWWLMMIDDGWWWLMMVNGCQWSMVTWI